MSKQYRKKPVIITAEQFVVWNKDGKEFKTTLNGVIFPVYWDSKGAHIFIPTLEGNMRADNLDWIIVGIKGEMYPCKPDIFEATYESV